MCWLTTALRLGITSPHLQANVLKAIGDVQQFRNERDTALQSYQAALRLFREIGDKLGEANVRMSLGDMLLAQEKWQEAIEHYESALPVYRTIGAQLGQANTLIDLGKAYFETNQQERGMGCVKEAGDIFARIGSPDWALRAYSRLADMLEHSGQAQQATDLRQQIEQLKKQLSR